MLSKFLVNEYLLLLLVLIIGVHTFIKVMLIMRYRQMNFFSQKLKRSFFYYDGEVIKEAFEVRIKTYYKLSNKINTAFYSLMMLHIAAYLFVKIASAAQHVPPMLSQLVAKH